MTKCLTVAEFSVRYRELRKRDPAAARLVAAIVRKLLQTSHVRK